MGMTGRKVQMDSKALPSFEVTFTVRLSDQSWMCLGSWATILASIPVVLALILRPAQQSTDSHYDHSGAPRLFQDRTK
jgi:hypothetical protein